MLYIVTSGKYELLERILSELNNSQVKCIQIGDITYSSIVQKALAYLCMFFYIPFIRPISKEQKEKLSEIKDSDKVLLWFSERVPDNYLVFNILKSKNQILYLWNSVDKSKLKLRFLNKLKKRIDIYTFDENDAFNYGLNYKSQLCYNIEAKNNIKDGVYFIGQDKGRYNTLYNLYSFFTEHNVKCDFRVIRGIESPDQMDPALESNLISFDENAENIKSCSCVLEIVKKGQAGLSVRALEAMFAHKKLITNNENIRNYDFYSDKNIFILDQANINSDELLSFVQTPFDESFSIKDKSKYMINEWIKEFI